MDAGQGRVVILSKDQAQRWRIAELEASTGKAILGSPFSVLSAAGY